MGVAKDADIAGVALRSTVELYQYGRRCWRRSTVELYYIQQMIVTIEHLILFETGLSLSLFLELLDK